MIFWNPLELAFKKLGHIIHLIEVYLSHVLSLLETCMGCPHLSRWLAPVASHQMEAAFLRQKIERLRHPLPDIMAISWVKISHTLW
jgi:hypothetical protein